MMDIKCKDKYTNQSNKGEGKNEFHQRTELSKSVAQWQI